MTALATVGAMAALAACAVPAIVHPQARLDVHRGPTYHVAVVAESEAAAEGTYTLVVERSGDNGLSRSQQGGPFRLAGGDLDTLSVLRVNVAPGDSVHADLIVEWSDGRTSHDAFREVAGAASE